MSFLPQSPQQPLMMPGFSPWQAPLAALFSGISAAAQPGGFSNFGAGVAQGQQNFQQGQFQQQAMQLRQQQIEQAQEEMRRANQEEAQRQAKLDLIKQTLAGSPGSPGSGGSHPIMQGGQSSILGGMTPQQSQLFSTYAQVDPEGAFQMLAQQTFAQPKDNSTDDQREYQQAVEQGFKGSILDFILAQKKAGAMNNTTTITTKDYGNIPPGYRLREGPDGVYMEAVPGSPAAAEIKAAGDKQTQAQTAKQQTADVVTTDVRRILDTMDKAFLPTTGYFGGKLSGVGSTASHDVAELVSGIKANTSIGKLQEMRNNSPTGGALGSVTEGENKMLADTIGSLDQSQSEEQFQENLKRVYNIYLDIVHGKGNGPERFQLKEPGNAPGGGELRYDSEGKLIGG